MTHMKASRADQAKGGALALQRLLSQVITAPHAYVSDGALIEALKTQGTLAGLDRAWTTEDGHGWKTFPTSLNTLKKYSDEALTGGFDTLNSLRLKAIEAIEGHERKKTRSNKRTKEGLTQRVNDHEHELDMLRQTNFLLLRALQESIGQIKSISTQSDPLTREKWASDAISTLLAITSLCIPPFNLTDAPSEPKHTTSTVTNIHDYRK